MSEIHRLVWHNGQYLNVTDVSPSIASISFHMGTGVFDGMMAYWTDGGHHVFKGEDHFKRFVLSASNMGLPLPWSARDLYEAVKDLLRQASPTTYYIRPIAYRGGPELWLTGAEGRPVDITIFLVPTSGSLNTPIACQFSTVERISSSAMPISWKVCGLYVNSYLARREAESNGFQDGIMLDRHGFVSEASASNVFFIKEERLFTPKLSGDVFPGITRKSVIDICRAKGIEVIEADIAPGRLEADGGFLCSTLMEIRPISILERDEMNTINSPVYQSILAEFVKMTRLTG